MEEECRLVVDGFITLRLGPCEVVVRGVEGGLRLVRMPFSEALRDRLARRLLDLTPSRGAL